MNLHELDSYKLADAVKFHNRLNPRLWDSSEHLLPEVRDKLLEIAADFQEFLGVPDLDVVDITVSGSNAAYSYTPHSDIDLHLVVKKPQGADEVYQELFNAKKYQYNDMHDIRIHGADVELYVQPADESPVSLGEYSVRDGKWLQVPRRKRAKIDQSVVKHKYEDVKARIESALKDADSDRIYALIKKIKEMRQAGLDAHGEFGPENLAFKMLRSQGYIERLYKAHADARDRELSLMEKKKRKKAKKKFTYGAYGGWFYPGYNFGAGETGDAGGGDGGGESIREVDSGIAQGSAIGDAGAQSTWDGVSPDTDEYLSEDDVNQSVLRDFIRYTVQEIGLQRLPKIHVHNDSDWSEQEHSFGRFEPETNDLHINMWDRHIMDVLRTTAHELAHARQHEIESLGPDAGETGSDMENEAHAVAGIIMRKWAKLHPDMFDNKLDEGFISRAAMAATIAAAASMAQAQSPSDNEPAAQPTVGSVLTTALKLYGVSKITSPQVRAELDQEVRNYLRAQQGDANARNLSWTWKMQQRNQSQPQQQNESSGYIPTQAQVSDLRFKMALTQDVRPGQTGKEANKMALKTDAQGRPALLMKTANLREGRMPQPSQGQGKYRNLNQPLGPETPPTMPAGTLRVDVSDVYDWYKLGQHISNMKGLGKHDFGAGPPSSVISFGDEETEHKFIQDLEATGLDVTDIDPADPKQPAGMRKIKTDPTYNVDEDAVESLRREFSLLEDEYLPEVKMSTANLRQLAAQTGALAGMEFEMILPNVETDVEPEYEPDYDQDQRARSFSDVRDFFNDGDYNSRRDADRLIEELDGEYEEWIQDQIAETWANDGADFMRDYVSLNDLFDRDEAMAQARDEIIDANPDLPQESEEFTELLSARLNEMETEFADTAFEDRGRIHDAAFEAFAEEQREEYDEGSFLDDKYPYMTDIQNNFDISWPYYYDLNDGQDGDMDVDRVADEFSSYMKKPVNASSSYHGARREAGHYVVEPDGSLEGDNPGDGGLEFVSPPMPIDEMISDLNKVKTWAGSIGAYTNDSTGLHINISVPDYSLDKLDYVKLALLMGDEYVLELFGRSGNTYAKAATGKIRTALQKNPDLAPVMMDKMRGHMEDLATKAIHSGITDKYTSINTKTGYIEFRSPGGDWLDANFDKIENTLLRFTVALSAAIDPEAYRQEYLKKLYKLLESSQEKGGVDVVQLFSNYSAGELDKAALIRQVREKQLARDLAKGRTPPGQKFWWKVTNPANSMASIEVVAAGKEEAIAKAVEPDNYPDWARVQNTLRATPLRPYQEPQAQPEQKGNWGIWMRSANRFARAPGQTDNSVLRRFPGRDSALQWIEQTRRERPDLRTDIEVREIPANDTASTQASSTGNWRIKDGLGRVVYTFRPRENTRAAATEIAAAWTRENNFDGNYTVVPSDDTPPQFQEPNTDRSDLTPRGPGPWEIYRISDNSSVRELSNTSRPEAEQEARNALGLRGEAPELYGVRTRQTTAQAPRTLTVPGQPQQQFTGEWKIVGPDGREIHRFGGIGNAQADANRVAIQWLQRNPRHMQDGVEVVPVMG
jgi:hypothetical protein